MIGLGRRPDLTPLQRSGDNGMYEMTKDNLAGSLRVIRTLMGAGLSAMLVGLAAVPAHAAPAKATAPSGLTGMWTLKQDNFEKREAPPYTAEARAIAKKKKEETEGGKVISDEGLKCLPNGVPTMMLTEFALEILESPGRVTMISESSPLVRSIYLNRTKATEGLEPMWNGYSVGHWEGKTLVVKTTNFNDRASPLGFAGSVHSATTTLLEKLSLSPDGQTLTDEMTMEDPRYLTRPFTLVRSYDRLPGDAELWEYACEIGGKGWAERFDGDADAAKAGK